MNIAIGSDHRGLDYKQYIIDLLTEMGHSHQDFGSFSTEPVDYPDIAGEVGESVARSQFDYGILICGTGIGISISANKIDGILCALPQNTFAATMAKAHNNANFLAFGGRIAYQDSVTDMLDAFIDTTFEGGRHATRVGKMVALERC